MKAKLKWKEKFLDDKSGSWLEAKVPTIKWEYIVEEYCNETGFRAGVFYSPLDEDVSLISKRKFKTSSQAKNACEQHLDKQAKKFIQWLKK